jgi:hypothetical protein
MEMIFRRGTLLGLCAEIGSDGEEIAQTFETVLRQIREGKKAQRENIDTAKTLEKWRAAGCPPGWGVLFPEYLGGKADPK